MRLTPFLGDPIAHLEPLKEGVKERSRAGEPPPCWNARRPFLPFIFSFTLPWLGPPYVAKCQIRDCAIRARFTQPQPRRFGTAGQFPPPSIPRSIVAADEAKRERGRTDRQADTRTRGRPTGRRTRREGLFLNDVKREKGKEVGGPKLDKGKVMGNIDLKILRTSLMNAP